MNFLLLVLAVCAILPKEQVNTMDKLLVGTEPRISREGFIRVLQDYHSPAAAFGGGCYDAILPYKLDPAVGLAFFIKESTAGTKGAASWTHNWGNIRKGGTWLDHHDGSSGDWLVYRTREGEQPGEEWIRACADWAQLIRELYIEKWQMQTAEEMLLKYAPYEDQNNPRSYAATIRRLVLQWSELYPVEPPGPTIIERIESLEAEVILLKQQVALLMDGGE